CSGTPQTFQNAATAPLADNGVTTSSIVVSGLDPVLFDVDVMTNLQHPDSGELDVTLTSPAGTGATLATDNADGYADSSAGATWDDGAAPDGQVPYDDNDGLVTDHLYFDGEVASPLVPEEALGAFFGENPNGTWTLRISDDTPGNTGSLAGWSLALTA